MATFIKGDPVPNATSYELMEKVGGEFNTIATDDEINFELDTLITTAGDHTLAVKAKADGYEDSDPSNEVVYSVATADFNGVIGTTPVLVSATGAVLEDGYTLDSQSYKTTLRNTAFTYKEVPVEVGATYYSEGAGRIWFLDGSKNGLQTANVSKDIDPLYQFTVPANAVYVSISYVPEATGVNLTASEVTIKKVG